MQIWCNSPIICKNICNRLGDKNSDQVGIGQDALRPFDAVVTSGWVQNEIHLQKTKQKQKD